MKKKLGITFGGLQKKTIALVLIVLILSVLAFGLVYAYQSRMLKNVVGETRREQQEAISASSKQTMAAVLERLLVSNTELEAELADTDFAEVIEDIRMLQEMAQGILENRDKLTPLEVGLPDPALSGISSAFVLCEEGVDYTESEYLGYIAHMSSAMIALHSNSDKVDGCFIGLEDGTDLCVDDKADNKYDASGALIPFPVRERPWYRGAIETGELYFTGIVKDAFSGALLITCSLPIECEGERVGVVGVDIMLSSVNDFVDSVDEGGFVYVVNDRGQVILGSDGGLFAPELSENARDLRESDNAELAAFIKTALHKRTGITELVIDGKDYYMVGSPMPAVGWTMISAVEKEITERPERNLLSDYESINNAALERFNGGLLKAQWLSLGMLGLILAAGLVSALIATKRIAKPIEEMTENVRRDSETGSTFQMLERYKTGDEIEVLAEAFAELSKRSEQYYEENLRITKEKERVSTELQMANQIQEGMLPSTYPPFPNRSDFDIFASMDPAKEVGGDFFDFFLTDEDHLCLVIADVSGKGIPAALFMMASKIILANNAMMGKSPAQILTDTNAAICSNNPREMFVTVWLGILELSSGRLICANAGHEYPVFKKPDGGFELFKDKHGFVVGGMAGVKYKEYELTLEPGTKLFVYTDGVPEATDAEKRLFGTERMLSALNGEPDARPKKVLENVRRAVDGFVGDAEQFDDLTMLCLEYFGSEGDALKADAAAN